MEREKVERETAAKQGEMEFSAQSDREKADREMDFQLKMMQVELEAQARQSQSHMSVNGSDDHTQ